ncbi:MAG: hypothetical protein LBI03_00995 [Clostridiales bacterium]|nr:hypothetical protein [Clostridiales bacterium]
MSKKKFGSILFCFIMAFSIFTFTVFAANKEIVPEDYESADEGMIQGAEFGEDGSTLYSGGRLQFMMGSWIKIDNIDLSLYNSIEITYGASSDLIAEDDEGNPAYFALSTVNNLTDAEPICKVDIDIPDKPWVPESTVVMNLNSDFKGDVYFLANLFDIGDDVDKNKANVVLIDFIEKPDPNATASPSPSPTATQAVTPTPSSTKTTTPTPSTTKTIAATSSNHNDSNSNTPWIILGIIAGVVVIVVVVTVIVVKKKKK